MGCDHGDRCAGILSLNVLNQFNAVTVRQFHVCQAEVKSLFTQQQAGRSQISGAAGTDIHSAKGNFEEFAYIRFVVNNQCTFLLHTRLWLLSELPEKGDTETTTTVARLRIGKSRIVGVAQLHRKVQAKAGAVGLCCIKGLE